MKKTAFLFLFVMAAILYLGGCKPRQANGPSLESSLPKEVVALCSVWKNDPYGCAKARTTPDAEAISGAFFKVKPDQKGIESMLGKAEASQLTAGKQVLYYYFDVTCQGGKMVDGEVYCVLEFKLDPTTLKLVSCGVVCG